MRSTCSGATIGKSASRRAFTRLLINVPSSFRGALPSGNHFTLLDLGGHVNHFIIVDVNLSVLYNTIRSLDETEIIDLGIHAER